MAIRREQLGLEHPAIINSILSLSKTYFDSGGAPKAIGLMEEALTQLPRNHPAHARISQQKMEVLGALSGGGFRQRPQKAKKPTKKRNR